jgi:hypothetical protein
VTPRKLSPSRCRIFGSKPYLIQLSQERPEDFARLLAVAGAGRVRDWSGAATYALLYTITGQKDYGERALQIARRTAERAILVGHEAFARELAKIAVAYDHAYDLLSDEDKALFHDYLNRTYEANIPYENPVFFNGYYGYKMYGLGLAAYATWPENPRAEEILDYVHGDLQKRAVPGLRLGGLGGGFPEGFYLNYFFADLLLFCETARLLEGIDYYALAPEFFHSHLACELFSAWTDVTEDGSRRLPVWGDGGRLNRNSRDNQRLAILMLANYCRATDPELAGYAQAWSLRTPRTCVEANAFEDFLWFDRKAPAGDLSRMKLAHLARGAGYLFARSSWDEGATWVFFKSGGRYTGHQHMDNNHFTIYGRKDELACDSGEYVSFHDAHAINWYMRTIAHNCILIHDPEEKFPKTRSYFDGANDGGQAYWWSVDEVGTRPGVVGPNGTAETAEAWLANRDIFDIARITAKESRPEFLYAVGDATRSYRPKKCQEAVRQFLYIRARPPIGGHPGYPDAIVIFDRVTSTQAEFRKTWLLHTMEEPRTPAGETKREDGLCDCAGDLIVAAAGQGKLFCRVLLPERHTITKVGGFRVKDYWYAGVNYAPEGDRQVEGAPHWRVEVSPVEASTHDVFLHVLYPVDADVEEPPTATVTRQCDAVVLETVGARVTFPAVGPVGGHICLGAIDTDFVTEVRLSPWE